MFSKAKRFEATAAEINPSKVVKQHNEKPKINTKVPTSGVKQKPLTTSNSKISSDVQSQSSSTKSVKSFVTPKPVRQLTTNVKAPTSLKKKTEQNSIKNKLEPQNEIIKAQQVEIRNKDHTIDEYTKLIEEFKNRISDLEKQLLVLNNVNKIDKEFSKLVIDEEVTKNEIRNLKERIIYLELQCERLELEVTEKQIELQSIEELITVRDSLCQDLQQKLTNAETNLHETGQRLEMVKGHHALALEANASIRREYKGELESLKLKMDEEKQLILNKCKVDQETLKSKYINMVEDIKSQMLKEKEHAVQELQQKLIDKENEMKAKIEQINEATLEKLRLCEIQFEERSRIIQDHCSQQGITIQNLEKEINDIKYNITLIEESKVTLQKEINHLKNENDSINKEKSILIRERDEIKEESKRKLIDFENEINRLTVDVDKALKEKNRFETSLLVTRDIVQVLTMRLRESDNELEVLEDKVQTLTTSNEILETELSSYKSSLNNTVMECNEYKEALVNILKSKAALAKEHNRIMEHNVSLIESLQNVEKEAYRELGSIKNELIEDVELLKKESNSQIQLLRDEVEKKKVLCELAKEHAGQATAAAEQSRVLLAQAAAEINRLESENQLLQQQIQDQQSLVVELSLLRQENEELSMTAAKQSSIIDKLKKDSEQSQYTPKSPSVGRKNVKIGKENMHTIISPLRERNH